MGRKWFYGLAAVWTLLALLLFVVGLTPGEPRMGAELLMTFLGFPVNLLVSELLIRLSPDLAPHLFDVHGPLWQYIIEWGAMFLLGGAQWFGLPSWLWHKWRARN